ncbi:MAG: hypothetical protein WC330_00740 [Candidatus Omnitrophota bacterium]
MAYLYSGIPPACPSKPWRRRKPVTVFTILAKGEGGETYGGI